MLSLSPGLNSLLWLWHPEHEVVNLLLSRIRGIVLGEGDSLGTLARRHMRGRRDLLARSQHGALLYTEAGVASSSVVGEGERHTSGRCLLAEALLLEELLLHRTRRLFFLDLLHDGMHVGPADTVADVAILRDGSRGRFLAIIVEGPSKQRIPNNVAVVIRMSLTIRGGPRILCRLLHASATNHESGKGSVVLLGVAVATVVEEFLEAAWRLALFLPRVQRLVVVVVSSRTETICSIYRKLILYTFNRLLKDLHLQLLVDHLLVMSSAA